MYCPKCKHTSFDHLATCPKCGYDWQSIRTALNLNWLQSAGHEWLPESAFEPPETEPEPGPSTSLEPMDFEPDAGAAEHFAFEEQAADFDLSPPEESLIHAESAPPVSDPEPSFAEDIPTVSEEILPVFVAASNQESFEVAPPETQINLDVTEDISLEAVLSQAEVVSAEEADTEITGQVDHTKPSYAKGAETDEENLSAWEIELPQDLLPQEYFPDPVGEERGPTEQNGGHEPEAVEVVGDIAYDFSEVEVLVPEPGEKDQSLSPGDTASHEAADREDAEVSSLLPSSSDGKERR